MNPKSTWNWILVAIALFAFIFFFERNRHIQDPGPQKLFPRFDAASVTSVMIRPSGNLGIRVDRTNDSWHLTKPIPYPAQNARVETLIDALTKLTPAAHISARELRQHPKADEEYGLASPQLSLTIEQGESRTQIWIGQRTAPGDQVFLQVVGAEGIYVVDADLLKLIPSSADEWRDIALVDLQKLVFDRVIITNGAKITELQYGATNHLWRITRPIQARADNGRVAELLKKLASLQVTQFITDNPKTDLEGFGLQPPELELALAQSTNTSVLLQFGKSPTNGPGLVYTRQGGMNSIVTVSNALLPFLRADVKEFRDHHLATLSGPVDQIEVHGESDFILQRQDSNVWKIVSESFPVDPTLVNEFITTLGALEIVQFKDAVTDSDLPSYGLTNPSRQITMSFPPAGSTNTASIQFSFGTAQEDKIFVRRSDEDSVYAVKLADFELLPTAAWQLRERRFWRFTENDVARFTIRQGGKVRELIHNGTNLWAFAPGSQGIINDFAIEETVHRFGELSALVWSGRGDENRERYGLGTNNHSFEFELKNGQKLTVELGGMSPSQYPYAATPLDGQTWFFEFPLALYQLVSSYLTIPADVP